MTTGRRAYWAASARAPVCLPRLAREGGPFLFRPLSEAALGRHLALTAPQPISEADAHALLEALDAQRISLHAAVNHAA